VFESVIAVVFQSVFCSEIQQNNIFFIFKKIIFNFNILKWYEKHQNFFILKQRKKLKKLIFLKTFLKCKNKQMLY
jgi:1-acyl-sn-glycerol-3-phosphate acyltransferase